MTSSPFCPVTNHTGDASPSHPLETPIVSRHLRSRPSASLAWSSPQVVYSVASRADTLQPSLSSHIIPETPHPPSPVGREEARPLSSPPAPTPAAPSQSPTPAVRLAHDHHLTHRACKWVKNDPAFDVHRNFEYSRAAREARCGPKLQELSRLCEWLYEVGNVDIVLRVALPEGLGWRGYTSPGILNGVHTRALADEISTNFSLIAGHRRIVFSEKLDARNRQASGGFDVTPSNEDVELDEEAEFWNNDDTDWNTVLEHILPDDMINYLMAADVPKIMFMQVDLIWTRYRRAPGGWEQNVRADVAALGVGGALRIGIELLLLKIIREANGIPSHPPIMSSTHGPVATAPRS